MGFAAALQEELACIHTQIAATRRRVRGDAAGGSAAHDEGGTAGVIILLAHDNQALAAALVQALVDTPGVTLVSQSTEVADRHDTALPTALLDVGLLSAAPIVIGAVQSTFTYIMYARALARPVLSLYRRGEGAGCVALESSEGGYLLQGAFPTGCSVSQQGHTVRASEAVLVTHDGRGFDFACRRRVLCITTYVAWKNTGKCLFPALRDDTVREQHGNHTGTHEAAPSMAADVLGNLTPAELDATKWSLWARALVGQYDGAEFVLSYVARWGGSVSLDGRVLRQPVCPYRRGPERMWAVVGDAEAGSDDGADVACLESVSILQGGGQGEEGKRDGGDSGVGGGGGGEGGGSLCTSASTAASWRDEIVSGNEKTGFHQCVAAQVRVIGLVK